MKEAALTNTANSPSITADYLTLAKPRITLMVVITALVGYFMASSGSIYVMGLIHTLIGTALVSAGANVLNQVSERDADARMFRTQNRPLPAGRVEPINALIYGTILGLGGLLYITISLNPTTGLLATATLASYVFVYTPLKCKTSLNTLFGAIPGALPPVGGWAAATGGLSAEAWVLFLIVYLWQIPHFLALAWILRDDYVRGGFRMLTVGDHMGISTGFHIGITALALLPVALSPTIFGMTGQVYFVGALILGLGYAGVSFWTAIRPNVVKAKWLFITSIIYLPALLAVMMIDRLPRL